LLRYDTKTFPIPCERFLHCHETVRVALQKRGHGCCSNRPKQSQKAQILPALFCGQETVYVRHGEASKTFLMRSNLFLLLGALFRTTQAVTSEGRSSLTRMPKPLHVYLVLCQIFEVLVTVFIFIRLLACHGSSQLRVFSVACKDVVIHGHAVITRTMDALSSQFSPRNSFAAQSSAESNLQTSRNCRSCRRTINPSIQEFFHLLGAPHALLSMYKSYVQGDASACSTSKHLKWNSIVLDKVAIMSCARFRPVWLQMPSSEYPIKCIS
jgi:hypothetical protein